MKHQKKFEAFVGCQAKVSSSMKLARATRLFVRSVILTHSVPNRHLNPRQSLVLLKDLSGVCGARVTTYITGRFIQVSRKVAYEAWIYPDYL